MKSLINLKNTPLIAVTVFSFILALASCSKISDEIALQEIKSAKEPSDIFETIGVKTKADTAKIRRLATSMHWDEKPLSQEQKGNLMTGIWDATLNNTAFRVVTSKGFDSEVGHSIELCMFSYTGVAEPAFVQNVTSKSGLQQVSPNNQIKKRPNGDILLSDTGREANSFLVMPFELNTFGSRTVWAIAANN